METGKQDSTNHTNSSPLRILVVDDDDLNRRMMHILLSREGHQVDLAANGIEALDAVKYHRFDIVFMDLQMPTIDGVEASRRIREWENGGMHTFIVALTASYLPQEGQRLFEAGIDNYIAKPFEVEHIQRMLNLLSKTRQPVVIPTNPVAEDHATSHMILDLPKGIERVGGDRETYKELLQDFLQSLPKRMETLEQYLKERNLDALYRGAHNLKGVASNLGALDLADRASKLDKQSNEGYTPLYEGLFLELKKAEISLIRTANDFLARKDTIVTQA